MDRSPLWIGSRLYPKGGPLNRPAKTRPCSRRLRPKGAPLSAAYGPCRLWHRHVETFGHRKTAARDPYSRPDIDTRTEDPPSHRLSHGGYPL